MKCSLDYFLIMSLMILNVLSQQNEISMSVQLGQASRQDIPIVFSNYQQSTLKAFRKTDRNYSLPLEICQIRAGQQGSLRQVATMNYSSSASQYNRDRVIYRLKDLQTSKIVIDSITINQQIIALFPPNQIIIYSFDQETQKITQQTDFKINTTTDGQLFQALFLEINNTLLLVSNQNVRKIYTNGSYALLSGYKPVTFSITQVQYLQHKLYIGLGEHGLYIYEIDSSLSAVKLTVKTQFVYRQNNETVFFDVDEFQVYPTQSQLLPSARSIYVLDYVQGLIQIALDKIQPETTHTAKPRYLASSCRNLILFWSSIFVTCPELVEISRQKYAVSMLKETNFLSQSVKVQKDRLFLFGIQDFAIYDIFGKSLAQYQLPYQSELSTLVQGYLLTFGRQRVIVHSIIPKKQQLYCYSNSLNDIGEYTGYIQTGGICKQYRGAAPITKKTLQIYCLVEYPIRVTLKNSAQINLERELLLGVIILFVFISFGLYLAFKHFRAHRIYGRLTQQQFKQVQDVGSQIMSKNNEKQRREEVVNPC